MRNDGERAILGHGQERFLEGVAFKLVFQYLEDIGFKKFFMYLFYLVIFSRAGSLLLCGLSLVVVSRGLLFIAVHGLLIAVAFLLWSTGSRAHRLQ